MCDYCVMQNRTPPDLVGSAAAADMLNIDRSTLTRWVKSQKITPALTGSGKTGEMFFNRAAVDALLTPPTTALAVDAEVAS